MDENELNALVMQILQGGLAEDQQVLLQHELAQAIKGKQAQAQGAPEFRGMVGAPSLLNAVAPTIDQAKGALDEKAIMGQRPVDPATGQPISMYGNLATAQGGTAAMLKQVIARLRGQQAPMINMPEMNLREQPQEPWGVKWPWEG